MMKLVTMISPTLLLADRVPVHRVIQEAGQYVVTFPQAYHAGWNAGLNIAEAVNFATEDWFPYGRDGKDAHIQIDRIWFRL